MVKTILCMAFLIFSAGVKADVRQDSINRLMKAQGIVEIFEQQKQYGKIEGEKQARKILDQILSRMNPNDTFRKRFSDAFMTYTKKIESPWSSEEITLAWAQYYGTKFSDAELNQLVEFYESPLGQKEQKASKEALLQF